MINNYLCFDLGGTFIKYGVVQSNGEILYQDQVPTPKHADRDEVVAIFTEKFHQLQAYQLRGIGISAHGIVDVNQGKIVLGSDFVKSLVDFPIVAQLREITGLPVVIENDVNAAALGELHYGSARQFSDCVFLTLGTSIGGAVIINGHIHRGFNGGAGEIGYIITQAQGNDGQGLCPGAWERYGSVTALMSAYREACNDDQVDHVQFVDGLHRGNPLEIEIFDAYLDRVVDGLISLSHCLAPQALIIGGAITQLEDALFVPLRKKFVERVIPIFKSINIVPTAYPKTAGLLGVVALLEQRS